MVKTPNTEKRVPKGEITYKLQLTEEQKEVKRNSFNYKCKGTRNHTGGYTFKYLEND
jgi:hypothetical protein